MQILGTLIIIFVLILIQIGRGVQLIGRALYALIRGLLQFFISYIRDVHSEIASIYTLGRNVFGNTRRYLRKRRLRSKRLKGTLFFSVPFRTKFKYFILGGIFSAVFIVIPFLFIIILENLPSPYDLTSEQIPQTTKIYDRNHTLLYEIYATQNRTVVPLSAIPADLKNATIAIEDKNFYKNPGIDFSAIIRAALADISGKDLQGGSTITQQLVKVSLLTPRISILRKIEEAILAIWSEKTYTKNQIFAMYFNRVPYGGTAWGVEAASEIYFNKRVSNLDLAQCAFLAGIPQAPSVYSPYSGNPQAWKKRQEEVLGRMEELGYISSSQYKQADAEQLTFSPPQIPIHAPHFVMYIKDLLTQKYGLNMVEKGGMEVTTSLDSRIQDMTQAIVSDEVSKDGFLTISNGAALVTNPKNGDILAMVGSHNYADPTNGAVNITTSLRQPGSSIKIVTYAAALAHGMTAATRIDDVQTTYTIAGSPPYSPVNYDGKWHGNVTIRTALANSLNIPAVKILNMLGIQTFIDQAKQLGITTLGDSSNYGLSLTLGAAEVKMTDMATAYGIVANKGSRVDLNPILKIVDANGVILEEKKDPPTKQVLDPGISFILTNILSDNQARSMEFGLNSPLYIPGYSVAVKTGTTDNKKDNWTIGYTSSYVVATWVGNNDGTPMNQNLASGITGAAPIWHKIMTSLLKDTKDQPLQIPSDIVQKSCAGKSEYFIRGTENDSSCQAPISPSVTQVLGDNLGQQLKLVPRVLGIKKKTCRYKSGGTFFTCS